MKNISKAISISVFTCFALASYGANQGCADLSGSWRFAFCVHGNQVFSGSYFAGRESVKIQQPDCTTVTIDDSAPLKTDGTPASLITSIGNGLQEVIHTAKWDESQVLLTYTETDNRRDSIPGDITATYEKNVVLQADGGVLAWQQTGNVAYEADNSTCFATKAE